MRKSIVISVACCLGSIASFAQGEKQVRNGNKLYEQKKYKEAGAAYQQALQKNPTYLPGIFNLGNSLYQQKQYEASRKVLGNAAKVSKDKNAQAGANYNIGNTYMSEQKWQDAVDAYKQALRRNPQDADAKYNLSYALQKLKKEQGGGGGKDNKDNKDKNDKNKDQQNKDNKDNKDKNDKGDQDKKDQQDKGDQNKDQQDKGEQEKDQQRPQPQPSKLSQQQAEQLLNALQQEEKKLQDKMQKEKGIPVKTDKDW